jgi:integrase
VETNLRRHVYPRFGNWRLASIRPSEVQAWVAKLNTRLSPSTGQVIHGILAAIYKAAIRDRRVNASPCEGTKLPKEIVPLESAVIEAIAETVPARYRALVIAAAGTGMRQGECFGLTLDRIDFFRRRRPGPASLHSP